MSARELVRSLVETRLWSSFCEKEIKLSHEVTDAHGGDIYGYVRADVDNKYAGHIDYTTPQGKFGQHVHVRGIKTHPDFHRQGIATAMMNHLKKEFPHRKINWGMTTPEGEKFKRAYYHPK